MEKKQGKLAIFLKTALIFSVLFILPFGSIYFLNKGKVFNREVMEELDDNGKVADFSIVNQNNVPISLDMLYGKVAVVNFLAKDAEEAKTQAAQMATVHGSFDDTEDVYFLTVVPKDTTTTLLEQATSLGIKDYKQWWLAGLDGPEWDNLRDNVFRAAEPAHDIVLVDTSLSIRHYYDGYNDTVIGNLVLHISKVIPKQKRR